MLTDFLRQQFDAYASIPVSTARLLAALADAAEVSVSVLRQLDERAAATNRVLHSFEEPLVRLAEAVDGSLVDSTVDALGRLPVILARAAALTDRADGLIAGLEAPVRALGPLSQSIDVGRLGGLVTRIEETLPGLVRIPEAETEVRRLRETLDRMYRVVDDVQGRFGALPGAGLLLRQRRRTCSTIRARSRPAGRGAGTGPHSAGEGRANRELLVVSEAQPGRVRRRDRLEGRRPRRALSDRGACAQLAVGVPGSQRALGRGGP